ncbi:hypothetical protein HYALB_00004191 [Hymenoscyphus albidus]|uniref:Uncharacterized protein n=1 Tax=Hymenoscyphus albidus TaxID=595503 RepID=A0A9N9Q3B3_9HELO|nr:hypothetical protein HYALB_00004191 [Hymenoscyphus albidus]
MQSTPEISTFTEQLSLDAHKISGCLIRNGASTTAFISFYWGAEVRTCRLQETFREGTNDEACTAQWAHPRMTYILPVPCPECAVERAAEEEECKARIEEWRTKDEEAKKRREELDRKREATLKDLHDKFEEARSKMKKWEKFEESGFEDDEESIKENESWDVEVETLSQSFGRSPTRSP